MSTRGRAFFRVCAVFMMAAASLAAARNGHEKLSNLIEAVILHGPDSRLPAHLSVVLGVSPTGRETPVKQAVMRSGDTVRTFNVCVDRHEDVVLIAYNEHSHASKAYLVSPAGRLRKAVAFQAGEPAVPRSQSDARVDLASELDFWTGLAKVGPPAALQPNSRPGPAGRP